MCFINTKGIPNTLNMHDQNINVALKQIQDYFKIAISVDCVIFGYDGKELKVLMIQCNMDPYMGKWSLLGDLVSPDEDLDVAAQRILNERVGFKNLYLEQVKTFGKIGRHPSGRVISVSYYSLVKMSDFIPSTNLPIPAKWWNIYEVEELAFDHRQILDACLDRLRKRVRYNPIGFNLLPKEFTLSQLQNLYEAILNKMLDKRNFRKKITAMGFLTDCHRYQKEVAHRPARLFSFEMKKYNALEASGLIFEL